MTSDAVALLLLDYMQCSPAAAGLQRCGLASAGLHAMQPCCCWTSTLWPCFCWTTCNAALLLLDFNAVALLLLDYMQCSPAAAGLQRCGLASARLHAMQPCCCWTSTLWSCFCWTTCKAALLLLDFNAVALRRLDHTQCSPAAAGLQYLAGLRWTSLRALQLLSLSPACPTLSWTLLDFTLCAAAAVTQPCMPHT
jgi:hypothetical protein